MEKEITKINCPYCNSNEWYCEDLQISHMLSEDVTIAKRQCKCTECNQNFLIKSTFTVHSHEAIKGS